MGRRKRGNRWLVWAEAGFSDLNRRRRVFLTVDTEDEAKRAEAKLQHEVYTGAHIKPSSETVPDFCDRYLKARARLAPATRTRYQGMIDSHIRPALRRVTLAKFTPEVAASWQDAQLRSGLSSTTVRKHAVLLRAAMDMAVEWGHLRKNPMRALERPAEALPPFHVYSLSEQAALLSAAAAGEGAKQGYHKGRSDGVMYVPIALDLGTGMRRGELLGLRESDVDLARGRLHVRQGARRGANGRTEYGPCKTRRSQRTITLPASVCELLGRYMASRQRHRSGRLLLNGDGRPMTLDGFASGWRRVRERAAEILRQDASQLHDPDWEHSGDDLAVARFHDIRHTHITELLRNGESVKVVAERAGDSEKTILTTYAHVLPDMQESAAAAIDGVLRGLLAQKERL